MTTLNAEPVFVDTDVLVAAGVGSAPLHQEAIQTLEGLRQTGVDLWISRQILCEYVAVLSRPRSFPQLVPTQVLARQVHQFERWFHVANDTARVTAALLDLMQRFPTSDRQLRDAYVVATMRSHGVPRLLTHNVGDFARFGDSITVMPLVAAS
jgi:predicted nucleic acid-binding protein